MSLLIGFEIEFEEFRDDSEPDPGFLNWVCKK